MNNILHTIDEAIDDFRQGKFLIVVDDDDRENEGDFIIPAENITPEQVNFMLTYGRGVLCAPLTDERCDQLLLNLQVAHNTSPLQTPFTVSVDLLGNGCTTGVSMHDRAQTLRALANPNTKPTDLARPGHINPLRAQQQGVLQRPGHTEAAIDLARLAGLSPAAALIEIINPDGSMARLPDLIPLSQKFRIKIISIRDLIAYRLQKESIIETGPEVDLPSQYGHFRLIPFLQKHPRLEHIALIKGQPADNPPTLVRVHSSCATGDIFASLRCECGEQLHRAMQLIDNEGTGVILYLQQEGRGIGLMDKIKAYKLQENGLDTVDANLHLGHRPDERNYAVAAHILKLLGIQQIRLLSNNPTKSIGLQNYGLRIHEIIPLLIPPNPHNADYLKTKKQRMGHLLP